LPATRCTVDAVRLIALAALLIAACSPALVTTPNSSPSASHQAAPTDLAGNALADETTWAELGSRPLQLSALPPGSACQTSTSATLPGSATAAAFGEGPVYPVTGGSAIGLGPLGTDGLRPGKVLWLSSPSYTGPALIRGARLDGPSDVRFSGAIGTALRFDLETHTRAGDGTDGSVQGWRYLPSLVYAADAGCYGFQIDMPDRTVTVTLLAKVQVP
jgi:hypothetical protein